MQSKKISISIGGAGFIGGHLAEALVNKNFEVIVVDNLSTGINTNLEKKKNV